jgi:hypothetical protein
MKLFILILSLIPLESFATDTRVLSGQTKHVVNSDGSKESLVTELNLNNCNINVSAVEAEDSDRISITFSNREFEAKGFSIKSNKDGTCTLALVKGKGVR